FRRWFGIFIMDSFLHAAGSIIEDSQGDAILFGGLEAGRANSQHRRSGEHSDLPHIPVFHSAKLELIAMETITKLAGVYTHSPIRLRRDANGADCARSA